MKFTKSLFIFFIILNIFLIKVTLSNSLYINFIPYVKGTKCDSKVIGIGYSMLLNTCISFDVTLSSWRFSLDQTTGVITGLKYNGRCDNANWNQTQVYKFQRDGCNQQEITFDMFRIPTQGFDFQIKISTTPVQILGTYVKQQLAGNGCSTSNLLLGQEFSTNGTISKSLNQYFTYYCLNRVPTVIDNNQPSGNYKGVTCRKITPYYNGTTTINYHRYQFGGDLSGSSGTGGYDTGAGGDTAGSGNSATSISSDTGDPTTASQTSDNPTTAYSTGDGPGDTASASSTSGGQTTETSGGTSTSGAITGGTSTNSDSGSSGSSGANTNTNTGGVSTNSGGESTSGVSTNSGGTSTSGAITGGTSGGGNTQYVYLYSYCN